jgi:hypothetical protein
LILYPFGLIVNFARSNSSRYPLLEGDQSTTSYWQLSPLALYTPDVYAWQISHFEASIRMLSSRVPDDPLHTVTSTISIVCRCRATLQYDIYVQEHRRTPVDVRTSQDGLGCKDGTRQLIRVLWTAWSSTDWNASKQELPTSGASRKSGGRSLSWHFGKAIASRILSSMPWPQACL